MIVVCVYKTGGDFDGEYVEALYETLKDSGYEFVCLTDADDVPDHINQEPLKYAFPKWWSKMELFDDSHPQLQGRDILYFDLDTVILDRIDELTDLCYGFPNMLMLRDFWFPKSLASGIMYIPFYMKQYIWNVFIEDPERWMKEFRGDQNFIEACVNTNIKLTCESFYEYLPDYIASYKTHIIKTYPRHLEPLNVDATKSKIVCYHGKPRPKDTRLFYKKNEYYTIQ